METLNKLNIASENKYKSVFSDELMEFIIALHEKFNEQRLQLLSKRKLGQIEFDHGNLPKFLRETKNIRENEWICAPLPKD